MEYKQNYMIMFDFYILSFFKLNVKRAVSTYMKI